MAFFRARERGEDGRLADQGLARPRGRGDHDVVALDEMPSRLAFETVQRVRVARLDLVHGQRRGWEPR